MCYKWVSVNLSLLSDFTCGLNLTTSSSVYVYKTPKSEEVRKHSTWPADNVLDFYLDPADNGRVQGSQGRANFQLLNENTYKSGNYFWENMSENVHYLSDLFIIKVEICDQSTDFMQNTQLLSSIHFIQLFLYDHIIIY